MSWAGIDLLSVLRSYDWLQMVCLSLSICISPYSHFDCQLVSAGGVARQEAGAGAGYHQSDYNLTKLPPVTNGAGTVDTRWYLVWGKQ